MRKCERELMLQESWIINQNKQCWDRQTMGREGQIQEGCVGRKKKSVVRGGREWSSVMSAQMLLGFDRLDDS